MACVGQTCQRTKKENSKVNCSLHIISPYGSDSMLNGRDQKVTKNNAKLHKLSLVKEEKFTPSIDSLMAAQPDTQ